MTRVPGSTHHNPLTQRIAWVLWPSFLMAGVMEVVFFTLVQPEDLHFFGEPVALSRQAIYTLGFFTFWAMAAGSSALTCFLQRSPWEMNRCTLAPEARPIGCPKRQDGCGGSS